MPKILVLLLVIPVLEVFLLIQTGRWLGFWPTLAILTFLGLFGLYLVKSQGFAVMARIREAISRRQVPTAPLMDGLMILASGLLLLIPGLLTDFMGLLLLIPSVRLMLRQRLTGYLIKLFVPGRITRIRW